MSNAVRALPDGDFLFWTVCLHPAKQNRPNTFSAGGKRCFRLKCSVLTPTVNRWGISHMHEDKIIVKGAKTHNLKNITVEMPRNKMIVFTGLSGSGKSSLAFA